MNAMLLMLREMMKLVLWRMMTLMLSQYPNYMHWSAGLATEHLVPRLDIELYTWEPTKIKSQNNCL